MPSDDGWFVRAEQADIFPGPTPSEVFRADTAARLETLAAD